MCTVSSNSRKAAPPVRQRLTLPQIFMNSRRDFHVRSASSRWDGRGRFGRFELHEIPNHVTLRPPFRRSHRDGLQQAAGLLQDEDGGAAEASGGTARAVARRAGRPGRERHPAPRQRGCHDRERRRRSRAAGRDRAQLPRQRRRRAGSDGGGGAVRHRGSLAGGEDRPRGRGLQGRCRRAAHDRPGPGDRALQS